MNISELFTTLYINIPSMFTASGGPPKKKVESPGMTIDHWISVQKYMPNLGDNNSTTTRQLSVAKQLDSSKLCHQKATPKSRVAIKVCTNNQRVAYVKKNFDRLISW